MIGKVFKVGYTKRKRIPILFQDDKVDRTATKWANIYLLSNHLFDATMRTYTSGMKMNSLILASRYNFGSQKITSHTSCIIHQYYPKSQIVDTGTYYIPVEYLFDFHFINGKYQRFESCHISKKQ